MVADALKSASITNLDASPIVYNTTGAGAGASVINFSDYVTPTAAGLADTSSKYKMVRLPFTAKLKNLRLIADAALDTNGSPTLVLDVGAYYSDSTVDGTPAALQGTAIGVASFASQITFTTAFQNVYGLKSFGVAKQNQPLWQALGLSANPGGFVDVVVAVHTGAATASSNALSVSADVVI